MGEGGMEVGATVGTAVQAAKVIINMRTKIFERMASPKILNLFRS